MKLCFLPFCFSTQVCWTRFYVDEFTTSCITWRCGKKFSMGCGRDAVTESSQWTLSRNIHGNLGTRTVMRPSDVDTPVETQWQEYPRVNLSTRNSHDSAWQKQLQLYFSWCFLKRPAGLLHARERRDGTVKTLHLWQKCWTNGRKILYSSRNRPACSVVRVTNSNPSGNVYAAVIVPVKNVLPYDWGKVCIDDNID